MPARLMVTKLVSGVASRKPPLGGWIVSKTRSVFLRVRLRSTRVMGFHVGR